MRWSSGDGVTLNVLAPSLPFLADTGDDVAACVELHAGAVKVGHRGSRYASTTGFVAAVHRQVAVISVGRHNTFGHPSEATIEAWHDTGADILRTDKCGAISLVNGSPTTMLSCHSP
jgi:competence protein ComEC